MGVTKTDGVITQLPYGLLKNINLNLSGVTILIIDASGKPRDHIIRMDRVTAPGGIPFYLNETVKLIYRARSQSSTAAVCGLWRVNPTTGVETLDSTVTLSAVRQRAVNINVTAFDGTTGAITKTVTYDV